MTLYRVTNTGIYHGQTIQNVIHFADNISVGGSPPTPQVIAEDIRANWLPAERLLHHDSFKFVQVECSEIRNPAPMPAHIAATTLTGNGGPSLSHSVSAFKIRMITSRGGRRGRGKIFIGGIPINLFTTDMVLTTTATDRLLAFCSAIEARYMVHDGTPPVPFRMMLVHKDVNDPPNEIITCTWLPVAGVQRRRNKLVGV